MLLFNEVREQILDAGGEGGGGTSDPAAAATATATSTHGSPPPTIAWEQIKSAIPQEYQADPSLKTISSLEGLVKSYVHAQKGLGNRIPVPDKHATPEDWNQTFRKLGVPEKLEDYKMSLPKEMKFDEEFVKDITKTAHEAGVLPFQMEKILSAYHEKALAVEDQWKVEQETTAKEDLEGLKKEWGEAFEKQSKVANVAFKELLPKVEDRERLVKDGLASHPAVLKMLVNAAKFFKEDTFVGHGEGIGSGMTPEDALSKARTIQGDANHPYRTPTHPNHKAAKKEVQDLYSIAFPDKA